MHVTPRLLIHYGSSYHPIEKSNLTLYIIIALILGIGLGFTLNKSYLYEENQALAKADSTIAIVKDRILHSSDSMTLVALQSQKKSLNETRNETLARRDAKTDPFSLLADIFYD